jgi:hypothetical protein
MHFCSGNIGKSIRLVFGMLGLFTMAAAQNSMPGVDADPNQGMNAAPLTVTLQDAIARARKK